MENSEDTNLLTSMNDLQSLVPLDIQLRTELKINILEASKLRRVLSKNVMSSTETREVTTEELTRLVDSDIKKTYKELQEKVSRIELKLETFQISYGHLLDSNMDKELEEELAHIYRLSDGLEKTSKNLLEEATRKNIRWHKATRPKIDISNIKIRFTGSIKNQAYHIYEFLELIQDVMKENNISYDKSGELIKSLSTNHALKCIEDEFGLQTNPDPDKIRMLLKHLFGKKHKILSQIKEEHLLIGPIPASGEMTGIHCSRYNRSQAHFKLIKKAVMVRTPCTDPDETEMDDYTEHLSGFLDSITQWNYYRESEFENQEKKFHTIYKFFDSIRKDSSLELVKQGIDPNDAENDPDMDEDDKDDKSYESDSNSDEDDEPGTDEDDDTQSEAYSYEDTITNNYESEDFEDELLDTSAKNETEATQEEYGRKREYIVTHVRDDSCLLCRFILSNRGCKPTDIRHITPLDDTSTVFVESCAFIRHLSVSDRLWYLDFIDFCPTCLQHSMNDCWKHHQQCMFASKQPKFLMCRDCPNRIITCVDHYENNRKRLQNLKRRYAAIGIEINIELN